jgi:hypothetical protein
MRKFALSVQILILAASTAALTGCVERKLTINTNPQGAVVFLNDEEIGASPATVSFNWYGDYNVRISKEGYETLRTHRKLNRPLHDYFPFDLFAQILSPTPTTDSYLWSFDLEPKGETSREGLIESARRLKGQL